MNDLTQLIEKIILTRDKNINSKIFGTNYLEILKYLIIDDISKIENSQLKSFKSQFKEQNNNLLKIDSGERIISYQIHYYQDALSKIKFICQNDTLSIVLDGLKIVTMFDSMQPTKSALIHIGKNMSLVISNKTKISENITTGSIILDIMLNNKLNNVI